MEGLDVIAVLGTPERFAARREQLANLWRKWADEVLTGMHKKSRVIRRQTSQYRTDKPVGFPVAFVGVHSVHRDPVWLRRRKLLQFGIADMAQEVRESAVRTCDVLNTVDAAVSRHSALDCVACRRDGLDDEIAFFSRWQVLSREQRIHVVMDRFERVGLVRWRENDEADHLMATLTASVAARLGLATKQSRQEVHGV